MIPKCVTGAAITRALSKFLMPSNIILPMRQSSIVHAWIAEDLLKWRVAGLKGESKRDHDGSIVMCQPPTERLSKLGG